MKKYTLTHLKGILANGKWVFLTTKEKEEKITYKIDLEICRSDLVFPENRGKGEKYFLRIEKYNSKYPAEKGERTEFDKDIEFDTIEKIIDFLDKNEIMKKEEWINE